MENNYEEYNKWKNETLKNYSTTLYLNDIMSILSFGAKKLNKEIASGHLKTKIYKGGRITSKMWLEEYMDSIQMYFDPTKEMFIFPQKQSLRKKKRMSIDFTKYNSFEELMNEFDNYLSIHDVALILCQHFDTIRKKLLRGEMKYIRNNKGVYQIEKQCFLDYISEHDIQYDTRDKSWVTYRNTRYEKVINFCEQPRSIHELVSFTELSIQRFRKAILLPLIKMKYLQMTLPEKPRHNGQQYIATGKKYE